MRALFLILLLFFAAKAFSQKDFCAGSKGDPIYHQNFEGGNAALPANFTNYDYVTWDPGDGEYTVAAQVGQDNTSWHSYFPNTTVSGGKALIVNADDQSSGRFFRTRISGLCQSTTYEFSAFLMNVYNVNSKVCENNEIPVNVRFEVWDETETILLREISTGDIYSTASPQWDRFGLTFQSQPGQQAIVLKMFNNGIGGCGNDLAIDDIIFRSCGDLTTVESVEGTSGEWKVCEEDAPVDARLTATPDYSVYSQHYYQWQQSNDGQTWQDISGETAADLFVPVLSHSAYFRVKVAENAVNLSSNYCSSASQAFFVNIAATPAAPVSGGDKTICSDENLPTLSVSVPTGQNVNWYNAPSGGDLLAENVSVYSPAGAGIFYAEAVQAGLDCRPGPRTAVRLKIMEVPSAEDETIFWCGGAPLELDAGGSNYSYSWSTGAASRYIQVSSAGIYSVEIENSEGCSSTKTVEVIKVQKPVITEVISEENSIEVQLKEEGEFDFSLDGRNYQESNIFSLEGGVYTVYVKNRRGCEPVSLQFAHLVIPQFITPNNDGYNDYFELKGVELFSSSEIVIFDRYGSVVAAGPGRSFKWDGRNSGRELPADDYWYVIKIEGMPPQKGHFSLLR